MPPTPSDSMTGKLDPHIAVEKLVDALSHLPTKLKLATSKDPQGPNSLDICTSIINSGAKVFTLVQFLFQNTSMLFMSTFLHTTFLGSFVRMQRERNQGSTSAG